DVVREANEFAEKQGKIAIPLSLNVKRLAIGRYASVEYQFRVVDQSDPVVRRDNLIPRPNIIIEKTEKTSLDANSNGQSEHPKDIYSELIKLDDLRKRGILTQEEFEAQKTKLLNEN